MKSQKYLNFTDTEIESILDTFNILSSSLKNDEFYKYISIYYKDDIINKNYSNDKLITFCEDIIKFISQKKVKLRVKTNLKLNKDSIIESIFSNFKIIDDNLLFWINLLLDFKFSSYEVYEDIDNMEDSYRSMYSDYIREFELGNVIDNDDIILSTPENKYDENISEDTESSGDID